MKKYLAIILLGAALLSLAACGEEEENVAETTEAVTDETTEAETAPYDEPLVSDEGIVLYDPDKDYADVDISAGIDANGYYEGIKASDIVTFSADLDTLVKDKAEFEPTADDVERFMLRQVKSHETCLTDSNSDTVAAGDALMINYDGNIDGKSFSGCRTYSPSVFVLGADDLFGDSLSALVGMKLGESKVLTIVLGGESTDESLIGKTASFTVTVEGINKVDLQLLAKSLEFNTVDELRADIAKVLYEDSLYQYFCELADTATYGDIPESIIKLVVDYRLNTVSLNIVDYGMTLYDVADAYGYESVNDYVMADLDNCKIIAKYNLAAQAIAEYFGKVADDEALALIGYEIDATEEPIINAIRQMELIERVAPGCLVK